MTQPDVRLQSDALRRHAHMVDEAANMLDEVAAAAGHLSLHDEVYGEWTGRLIVPFLNIAQDHASREMRSGSDATSHLAGLLRSVADNADLTDHDVAQRVRRAGP